MQDLSAADLVALVRAAFPALPGDRALAVLVDVPRDAARDNPDWATRRRMGAAWAQALSGARAEVPLAEVHLAAYPDVGSNNADLPADAVLIDGPLPPTSAGLDAAGRRVPFATLLAETQLILAPTEYSTTAPLKVAAKRLGFRAATMPGFGAAMIPALRVDYAEVARRVALICGLLDRAAGAEVCFRIDGARELQLHVDLRHRTSHASAGRFPERGTAGNLPSGEAYIVPYEGEQGEPSRTAGQLPVQLGDEVVVFVVRGNRAVEVAPGGAAAEAERAHLAREPAYGNIAELGFGVLGDFGLTPVGEILLDEKLGLHIAFGRSEHFGGIVGPADFSSPSEVIHLDRIYIPAMQPRVSVAALDLLDPDGGRQRVISDGRYLVI